MPGNVSGCQYPCPFQKQYSFNSLLDIPSLIINYSVEEDQISFFSIDSLKQKHVICVSLINFCVRMCMRDSLNGTI